jgi:hypothetical protein
MRARERRRGGGCEVMAKARLLTEFSDVEADWVEKPNGKW